MDNSNSVNSGDSSRSSLFSSQLTNLLAEAQRNLSKQQRSGDATNSTSASTNIAPNEIQQSQRHSEPNEAHHPNRQAAPAPARTFTPHLTTSELDGGDIVMMDFPNANHQTYGFHHHNHHEPSSQDRNNQGDGFHFDLDPLAVGAFNVNSPPLSGSSFQDIASSFHAHSMPANFNNSTFTYYGNNDFYDESGGGGIAEIVPTQDDIMSPNGEFGFFNQSSQQNHQQQQQHHQQQQQQQQQQQVLSSVSVSEFNSGVAGPRQSSSNFANSSAAASYGGSRMGSGSGFARFDLFDEDGDKSNLATPSLSPQSANSPAVTSPSVGGNTAGSSPSLSQQQPHISIPHDDWVNYRQPPQQQQPRQQVPRAAVKLESPTVKLESPTSTTATTSTSTTPKPTDDKSAASSKKKEGIECTNCKTKTTPLWRRNPEGQPLCNACGLFLKLHGETRPISLKTDVIKKRNRNSSSGATSTARSAHSRENSALKPLTPANVGGTTTPSIPITKKRSTSSTNLANMSRSLGSEGSFSTGSASAPRMVPIAPKQNYSSTSLSNSFSDKTKAKRKSSLSRRGSNISGSFGSSNGLAMTPIVPNPAASSTQTGQSAPSSGFGYSSGNSSEMVQSAMKALQAQKNRSGENTPQKMMLPSRSQQQPPQPMRLAPKKEQQQQQQPRRQPEQPKESFSSISIPHSSSQPTTQQSNFAAMATSAPIPGHTLFNHPPNTTTTTTNDNKTMNNNNHGSTNNDSFNHMDWFVD